MSYRKRGLDGDALLAWVKGRCTITPEGCWLWPVTSDRGYGLTNYHGKSIKTHNLTLRLSGVEVPEGQEPNHDCRHRACCNPEHLTAMTHAENVAIGDLCLVAGRTHGVKTHCPSGHAYEGDNVRVSPRGHRYCRACARIYQRARRATEPETTP